MQYIVCRIRAANDEAGPDEVPPVMVLPPLLCRTKEEAEAAVLKAHQEEDMDWSLWEIVDGRCVQRSVIFSATTASCGMRAAIQR